MRLDCPECTRLWEEYCQASAEEFRLQEALGLAKRSQPDHDRIASLSAKTQLLARRIAFLGAQVKAHRLQHAASAQRAS